MICTLTDMSHASIIDMWPSLAEFAADLGVPYGTAKAMRRRASIPANHWAAVVKKAQERDIASVTLEALAEAKASAAA